MGTDLVHANVVLVARQFNPTIFSQTWLTRHGLVSEDDFSNGAESLFTPPVVQVRSREFVLLVLPEQLQFAPDAAVEDQGKLVLEKVGTIVTLLPETPYTAVGLNYHWHLVPERAHIARVCRALFFRTNPLYECFDQDDARFGGYLSKDVFGGRLKLDIKPIRVGTPAEMEERLQLAFNFHADLSRENPVDQIREMLGSWDRAKDHARQIVSGVEKWQWE